LLATVFDTTALSRADNHLSLHTYNVAWQLSVATGITEPDIFRVNLRIFPNPVQENITVQYKLEKTSDISIQLVTADGKATTLVQQKKQNAGTYSIPFTLNQYGLPAGTYFVVFKVNGNTIVKELVKLN
jgi:hypothetical protein